MEEQHSAQRKVEQGRSERRTSRQGNRKSDESLTHEIQEILTKDPELDAIEVDVAVEGGVVTLNGTVDSSDAKLLAEELVESVTGVRQVHNRLKVERR